MDDTCYLALSAQHPEGGGANLWAGLHNRPLLGLKWRWNVRTGGREVEVTYFLVRALDQGAADEGRQLAWLGYEAARARLTFDDARALLDDAMEAIKR